MIIKIDFMLTEKTRLHRYYSTVCCDDRLRCFNNNFLGGGGFGRPSAFYLCCNSFDIFQICPCPCYSLVRTFFLSRLIFQNVVCHLRTTVVLSVSFVDEDGNYIDKSVDFFFKLLLFLATALYTI